MKELVPASQKLGLAEAKELLADAKNLHVAKGKAWRSFKGDELDAKETAEAMLGPTGNLRAPTIRVGKTILVGFHEEPYGKVLS